MGYYLVTFFSSNDVSGNNLGPTSEVETLRVGTVWWKADAASNNKLISVR